MPPLRGGTCFHLILDSPLAGAGRTFPLQEKYQKCPQGGFAALENPLMWSLVTLQGVCLLGQPKCRYLRLRALFATASFGCYLCTHWAVICWIVFPIGADSVRWCIIKHQNDRSTAPQQVLESPENKSSVIRFA